MWSPARCHLRADAGPRASPMRACAPAGCSPSSVDYLSLLSLMSSLHPFAAGDEKLLGGRKRCVAVTRNKVKQITLPAGQGEEKKKKKDPLDCVRLMAQRRSLAEMMWRSQRSLCFYIVNFLSLKRRLLSFGFGQRS